MIARSRASAKADDHTTLGIQLATPSSSQLGTLHSWAPRGPRQIEKNTFLIAALVIPLLEIALSIALRFPRLGSGCIHLKLAADGYLDCGRSYGSVSDPRFPFKNSSAPTAIART